jgi:LPXTG-motif cell wall-anchored protein
MDNVFVQAGLWVGAAAMLLLYFRRRRNRKIEQ